MTEKFQKLVDSNIELLPLPEIQTHFVFHRDGFAALVDRVRDTFGSVGTAGLLTEKGIAPLLWRANEAYFVLKGFEQPATSDQVRQLRSFQADLEAALA
jgi:hypothetical protein